MPDTSIDEIKNRLDIVEIIQEYVRLKKSGANYKALCPFHNEKTPSFMVSQEKQIWHCFGCSEGGDIFGFIQKIEGVEFPEALRILAEKAGVELKRQDPVIQNQKTRLMDICELSADYYHQVLLESVQANKAREYLKSRGIDSEAIDQFKLGYSSDSWDALYAFSKKKGFSEEEIFLAGLTVKKEKGVGYYDRFRNRLMFPIKDVHGNTIGFGGRVLEKDVTSAKYINSPQTLIYNKSYILFGLDQAKSAIRKSKEVIVVEGYTDCITAHLADIKNVVASSGTALTEGQIRLLKRFTPNITMAFDRDAAGAQAAKRGIEVALSQEMNVKVLELPSGKDPDECIRENKAGFIDSVKNAKSYLEYYFTDTFKKLDVSKVADKKEAAQILLPVIAQVANPIEQTHWLKELAKKIEVSEEILREKIKKKTDFKKRGKETPQIKPIDRYAKIGEELLGLLLYYPEQLRSTVKELLPEYLNDERQRLLYKKVIVYYTENEDFNFSDFQNQLKDSEQELADYLDILKLLGEDSFLDLTEELIQKNIKERVGLLKRNNILYQLKNIEREIKALEEKQNNDQSQKTLDLLSERFNELTNQLHQLEQ